MRFPISNRTLLHHRRPLTTATAVSAVGLAISLIAGACTKGPIDSAGFVTTLGTDTLSTERFRYSPDKVEADVVVRTPRTMHIKYTMDLADDGSMKRLEAISTSGSTTDTTPIRRQIITRSGDSLQIEVQDSSGSKTTTVAADSAVLPFLEFTHWPFEVAMMRARNQKVTSATIPLLTNETITEFPLEVVGTDSMTITHPVRGVMRAAVDKDGRIQEFFGPPTRRVVVERVQWLSDSQIEKLASDWTALDADGKGIKSLSGQVRTETTLGKASVSVEYGQPLKRGRVIWGDLVPWNKVWRTGANEATKLTTNHELIVGSGSKTLRIPAGSYSLFTIPNEDGTGTFIVNKQTGQNGARYDESQDLGRVPLTTRKLANPVEAVTVVVDGPDNPGMLEVQWDTLALAVPVKAK